ncbi:MAG: HNH endonuclease signature motif containing protein [Acidimicrobiales bacterium]
MHTIRFERLVSVDVADCDAETAAALLVDITFLRRVLDGREVAIMARLEQLADDDVSVDPEKINARATCRPARAAAAAAKRARAAAAFQTIHDAVTRGELNAEFLDAFQSALGLLPEQFRPELLALETALVGEAIAGSWTIDRFRDRLRVESKRIEGDDGKGRLERQKAESGARWWTDRKTGMWCISGRFDPETAISLQQRLIDELERVFHADRPDGCPKDPLLAQEWLRGRAMANLLHGLGAGVGEPEAIIVIDQHTYEHGPHGRSRVDCGHGLEVPLETLRGILGRSRFVPVVINSNGVVIRQGAPVDAYRSIWDSLARPVSLDHGRARRTASPRQRRALRAMYRTCAIPGCERHVASTEAHHLVFWEAGGATDLSNLLPLCRHHHDRLHAEHWTVELHPDRSLTIRRHGEVIMTTGPPCDQWA